MSDSDLTVDLPLLPLRDVVVYPHMVIPLFVGREKSIAALEAAMDADKSIVVVAQRDAAQDDPSASDLYQVGTTASVLQLLKLPDDTVKVLVEGRERVVLGDVREDENFLRAEATVMQGESLDEERDEMLLDTLHAEFEQYVGSTKKVPKEVLSSLTGIDDVCRLADTVAAHMALSLEQKQDILEVADIETRVDMLLAAMDNELELVTVEKSVRGRVKKQMEKSQREYYLNEQMKAIQKELGELDDAPNEVDALQEKIGEAGMPKEALEKTQAELSKLKMMSPMSAEASVVLS
jgi:ATP-dependent Lon protease